LIGKGINVMLSPLPRAKRAKNPNEGPRATDNMSEDDFVEESEGEEESQKPRKQGKERVPVNSADKSFGQTPFAELNTKSS
jgi:hypothetical protein